MHTRDFPLPRGPSRRQLLPSARVTVPLIRSESCLEAVSLTEDWFKLEGLLSGECKFLRIPRLYKLRRDSGIVLELLVKRSEKGEICCMSTGGVSSMELQTMYIEGLGEGEASSPNTL
jgi:hypothetical protein